MKKNKGGMTNIEWVRLISLRRLAEVMIRYSDMISERACGHAECPYPDDDHPECEYSDCHKCLMHWLQKEHKE